MKQFKISIFFFLTVALAFGQKSAFVNEGKLLKATKGYEQAVIAMDTLKNQMQKEIATSRELLSKKFNNLISHYSTSSDANATMEDIVSKLSESDKKKFELLKEESQLLEKQLKNKEEEYKLIYNEKVGVLLDKVNAIVADYCKKNKIDILYKIDLLQPAIAYYDNTKDITSELSVMVSK